MTLLEKCRAEHPGLDEGMIIAFMCPCDFGYERLDNGCNPDGMEIQEVCAKCWNREAAGDGV